ncbi:hypothetical protein DXV75_04945 [Alteromonas aestuariivivens]|uniref:Uncharacterized protein n=1 Tax=Alteromonas aestuariivivens TaxID=1938339 RepID=A0A3D8MAR9_9ALTE|nr:hypothetical protein DXV75_04945 [Alteromonas aestuariivivens]
MLFPKNRTSLEVGQGESVYQSWLAGAAYVIPSIDATTQRDLALDQQMVTAIQFGPSITC